MVTDNDHHTYVKDEFVKQRMSDYIDDIVKGADAYEDERKRIKYIRDCLGLQEAVRCHGYRYECHQTQSL